MDPSINTSPRQLLYYSVSALRMSPLWKVTSMRYLSPFTLALLVLSGCANVATSSLKMISVTDAPKAAGPYSQGVVAGGMLYTAGITPRDPLTNTSVQGDITVQTNRVFDSLEAILKGAGCSLRDVVKVTVYLADIADFPKMNDVMATRFGDHKPARTTLQPAKLPGGASLEIDFVARVP